MPDKRAAIRKILNRITESVHNLDYEGVRDLIPDDGVYFRFGCSKGARVC